MNIANLIKHGAIYGFALVLLAGCKLTSTELPAISDSGVQRTGHVVWHDLVTPDLKLSQQFYQSVFGWQFESVNDDYLIFKKDGIVLGGMAKLDTAARNSLWLSLVSVTDIDAVAKQTVAAGGKVLVAKTTIEGRGDIAVLHDPQGAVFALISTVNGDPAALKQRNDHWLWQEVWSDDPAASQAFYRQIGQYQAGEKQLGEHNYPFLRVGNDAAFGFVKKPDPQIGNTWVSYIKVDNVQQAVARVTAAGGNILMAPSEDIRQGTVAIVSDPAGAGLVLQETK